MYVICICNDLSTSQAMEEARDAAEKRMDAQGEELSSKGTALASATA